jgi:DNA-binding transcriptional LysR family regulator
MLDLTDLRTFARIADAGSISGAARALGVPKSSVSRSLVRIEKETGAMLVERSTRRLALTDAGLLLQRHARRILDDVGEAEAAIAGFVGVPRGTLRVSAPPSFAAGPLAPMLPAFLARYRRCVSCSRSTTSRSLSSLTTSTSRSAPGRCPTPT